MGVGGGGLGCMIDIMTRGRRMKRVISFFLFSFFYFWDGDALGFGFKLGTL